MVSDAGITAGAAAAVTGVITFPILAAMGIDPPAIIAGLLGCTIAQTLLPQAHDRPIRSIVMVTIGSVLFASMVTPVAAPWVAIKLYSMTTAMVQYDHIRAGTAGFLGAFAQPILILVKRGVYAVGSRFARKEGGDA